MPTNVGLELRTTLPVPVFEATPVPPRATANIPVEILVAFRAVKLLPTPVNDVDVTVPLNMGLLLLTLDETPVN